MPAVSPFPPKARLIWRVWSIAMPAPPIRN